MKTVQRQDGSLVELSEKDAETWIKKGLATEPVQKSEKNQAAQPVKPIK